MAWNVSAAITLDTWISLAAAGAAVASAILARHQAKSAKMQADAAKEQADLARAQLDAIRRSDDEERVRHQWKDQILARLRAFPPSHTALVDLEPGDKLFAEWAASLGYIALTSTTMGPAVTLTLAERLKNPDSPEGKMAVVKQQLLTSLAQSRQGWVESSGERRPAEEWAEIVRAIQQLRQEGLIETNPLGRNVAFLLRLTDAGAVAAAREDARGQTLSSGSSPASRGG